MSCPDSHDRPDPSRHEPIEVRAARIDQAKGQIRVAAVAVSAVAEADAAAAAVALVAAAWVAEDLWAIDLRDLRATDRVAPDLRAKPAIRRRICFSTPGNGRTR